MRAYRPKTLNIEGSGQVLINASRLGFGVRSQDVGFRVWGLEVRVLGQVLKFRIYGV